MSSLVDNAQDYYAEQGADALRRGDTLGFFANGVGYTLSAFAPRSVQEVAIGAVAGPVIGKGLQVAMPAIMRAAPILGRDVGSLFGRSGRAGLDAPYSARAIGDALEARYPGQVTSSTLPSVLDKNVALAGTRHPVSGIVFDNRGFPVFDDIALFDTRIASKYSSVENSPAHMRAATRDLRESIARGEVSSSQFTTQQLRAIEGGKANVPDLTWHHHQDVGRMQLVPTKRHQQTGHIGGYEMWFR